MSELKAFSASELGSFGASELSVRGGLGITPESTFRIRASGNEAHIWAPPGADPGDEDWLLLKTLTTTNELLFDEYVKHVMDQYYGGLGHISPTSPYTDGILMLPRSGGSFAVTKGDTWAQTASGGADGWERYAAQATAGGLGYQRVVFPTQTTDGGRINAHVTGGPPPTHPGNLYVVIPNSQFTTWSSGNGYPRGMLSHPIGENLLSWGATWSDTTWPLSSRSEATTVIGFGGVPVYFNNIDGA